MGVPKPAGYASTGLQPGIFIAILLGTGSLNIDASVLKMLVCGMMTSGTASVATVYDVSSTSDADTYFGAGSEIARMCYKALGEGKSTIEAIATAEPSGGTKATVTVTVTGTWTAAGTYYLELDGDTVGPITIGAADAVADVATSIAAAVTARGDVAFTAGAALGVATLTRKNKGLRGRDGSVYHDTSALPSGCSIALAGSATLPGGGVRPGAAGGAGVDDVTSCLTAIYPERYHRIAAAQSDATQEAQWETHVNNAAGIGEQRYQHVVLGTSGTTGSAVSLAQTTCNDARVQLVYQRSSVATPAELAAAVCSVRVLDEADWINTGFDGRVLKTIDGQKAKTDYLSPGEIRTLLAAGVTPIVTKDGNAQIEKSVTTKSQTSSLPDYRVDSTNKAVVPDYVADIIFAYWTTVYKPGNPVVADDPGTGQPERPQGTATPRTWNAEVSQLLKGLENVGGSQKAAILQDVDANPPQSSYDTATESIISVITVKPARLHHKAGVSILGI